jgi:hypothetical protein
VKVDLIIAIIMGLGVIALCWDWSNREGGKYDVQKYDDDDHE